MFVDYGHFVTYILHIQRGTKTASLIQTYVDFAISGLIHAQASRSLPPAPPFTDVYDRFTCLLIFSLLQAVGVSIEDVVISVYSALYTNSGAQTSMVKMYDIKESDKKGLNVPWWAPWLGRLWVMSWGLFTSQWALNAWLKTEQGMLTMPGGERGSIIVAMIGFCRKYYVTNRGILAEMQDL